MDFKLNHGFDFPKPPLDLLTFGKSVPKGLLLRETGFKQKQNCVSKEFQSAAEDKLVLKNHELMHCTLPGSPTRSTFLMVFSPDGKRVASTHGNHNIYVTDLTSGKNINTLTGHPRTPWCIAFHPSSNQILASGCLAGQVRVWDLSGGSEIWTVQSQTVIASIAFHPTDRMLVIATYNELYFWDWSKPEPFAKCHTSNEKEKVRYVAFDPLGHKIITGISNALNIPSQWDRVPVVVPPGIVTPPAPTQGSGNSSVAGQHRTNVAPDQERRISMCYRSLVEQYDQLVRRYYDLSRSRATPTTDRGTDPMDIDAESSPGYFQPPTTSRTANWRSANPSRDSARMSIHHTQRRPVRSRLPGGRRLNSSYLSPEAQLRSSRPHSESLSRRRFFHCHRRRRPSCSTYGPNLDTPTNNIGGSGLQYGVDRSSNNSTEPTNANATDHRVHVRTYEVGQSGPVLPSFSLSHYLQDALRAVATDELSARRRRSENPPSSTNDQADSSGSFFVSHRSAFVPRTPSGWRPLPRLNRFNVSPVREPRPESDNSADVGVRYGIQLLSRHIDNMQQLCRARLEILQLQQIRRMWEHLQRQIRSLHVAVHDGTIGPINIPEHSHMPASHTRSRETVSYQNRNLSLRSGLQRSAPITTEDVSPSEGIPSRNRSTNAQEETHVPSSLQPESPYIQGGHPVAGSWETEESASTTLSTTASSTEDTSVGDGESSTLATASSSSSQASNSNFEAEDQQSSLMSLLPFRRLSGLRRRRLLSAFMRIEREMGIGRGLSSSPVWRSSPTNPFQRLTRDNSCNTNEGNVPQNSQSSFRSTEGKKSCYNLRNQNYSSKRNEKASQSQATKKNKDECQVKTSSHIESEPGPSTSNGSSIVSAKFRKDFMDGSCETPQPGSSGLGTLPVGMQRTDKSGDTGKKTDKTLGKKQKLASPPWRLSTVPENLTFERVLINRDPTRPNRTEDAQLEEETLRNNNTNTAESRRTSKPSSFRKKSDPTSLPSSSRSTNVQHSRSTESMTLRPMIAQLEALVHQQRNYQHTQGSGASDGSPLTHSNTITEESRPRPTSRATGASPTSSGLLRNYNDVFRDGTHYNSGSNSEAGHHHPSAEERLTSALENETDHVNRLHQRPSGSQATQRRSGELEATRLRARQVLSLMVESLTQFFEENGLSGNTPQPGVLDDQIYNLYVLLQLALELTDLLLAQLVSSRFELEHQWTHRLRSPVALDASTGVEPQRVYARTRGSMRGRREYRNMLRLIAQQRHEHQTHNEDPATQPCPSVSALINRNTEMRNEYIMRVHRFRNSMPQVSPGTSTVQESINPSQQQQQQQPEVFTVPLVRLNDVLVLDTASLNHQPRQRPQSPPLDFPGTVPHPQQLRYLHPRYFYPQHFDSRQQDPGIDLRASPIAPEHMMSNDTPTMPTHRIQAWEFSRPVLPNISNAQENIVASECKIHNDASVDISNDGHLLVTLLPSGRLSMSTMLGIYSLQWHTLGQCLYTTSFEQNAVSVSLSPISRHLLVGLACRRVAPMSNEYLPMAQIFRLDDAPIPGAKGRLCLLRDVEQGREQGYMSINCIRWAPWPGQGLVYGTNTGQLKVLR